MERLWIGVRTVFYTTLFLSLWAGAALIFRLFDKFIPLRTSTSLVIPGLVLALTGVALCLVTVGFFVFKGHGTPAVFDPPTQFVPHGPYRIIRNPMYVGYVMGLLGFGLALRSVAILMFAIVAFILIHTFVVLVEEPGLRRRFGNQYENYCLTVARWVPRATRRRRVA